MFFVPNGFYHQASGLKFSVHLYGKNEKKKKAMTYLFAFGH